MFKYYDPNILVNTIWGDTIFGNHIWRCIFVFKKIKCHLWVRAQYHSFQHWTLYQPLHDSNAVNLETIDLGGKTLKKLWISWGSTIQQRCKLPTHVYVTTCYGKSSERMVGYPSYICFQKNQVPSPSSSPIPQLSSLDSLPDAICVCLLFYLIYYCLLTSFLLCLLGVQVALTQFCGSYNCSLVILLNDQLFPSPPSKRKWFGHKKSRRNLPTHVYVTTCYGKSSERMVGYPSRIVTKTFGKFKIWDGLQKCGLLGGST